MNVITIIQARMSSTRLPGKALLPIAGKPMIQWVVEAAPEPRIVALPNEFASLEIVKVLAPLNVPIFIPDASVWTGDVLGRFAACVAERAPKAKWVLRLTADCPTLTRTMVQDFINDCGNYIPRCGETTIYTNRPGMMDGHDMELFSAYALEHAAEKATNQQDREHVTPWMYRTMNVYRVCAVWHENTDKLSVDTEQEYKEVCHAMSKVRR